LQKTPDSEKASSVDNRTTVGAKERAGDKGKAREKGKASDKNVTRPANKTKATARQDKKSKSSSLPGESKRKLPVKKNANRGERNIGEGVKTGGRNCRNKPRTQCQ